MKPLVVITYLGAVWAEAQRKTGSNTFRQAPGGDLLRLRSLAAAEAAPRSITQTARVAAALSSASRAACTTALRGGGIGDSCNVGEVSEGASLTQQKRQPNPSKSDLEREAVKDTAAAAAAAASPHGEGLAAEGTAEAGGSSSDRPDVDGGIPKPAAAAAVPATQEPKGDSKEKALREALLSADGPNKVLREVERIPALRRLSDSALRVTSATPSDGRLAALALYRLGAAARSAESSATSASAAAAAPAAAPASAAASAAASASAATAANGELTAVSDGEAGGGGRGAEDGSGGVVGGKDADSIASPVAAGAAPGQALASPAAAAAPNAVSSGTSARDEEEPCGGEETQGPPDAGEVGVGAGAGEGQNERGREGGQDSARADAGVPVEGAVEGGVVAAKVVDSRVLAGAASHVSESEGAGAKEVTEKGEGATPTQVTAAPPAEPAAPAAVAAFDMEDVRSDQRFEQLVEIIECVAEELSVSDTSKVVWGLSILGHVPRNSLLESLAGCLTARLQEESAAAAAAAAAAEGSGPPSAGSDGSGGDGVAHEGGEVTSGGEAADEGTTGPASSGGEDAGKGAVAEGGGGGAGELQGSRGAGTGSDGANRDGVSGSGNGGGGGIDRKAAIAEKADAKAVVYTSGSDLATAALSFAYAHARLDISTGGLLDVVADCVTPQLSSTPLRDLASLSWAFAVQRRLNADMMAGISREIVSRRAVGRMTAKDASIFAWAYGMLGLRPSRVIRCLTREGLSTIQDATPHDLSNLAWGLARAGTGDEGAEEEGEEEGRAGAEAHLPTSASKPAAAVSGGYPEGSGSGSALSGTRPATGVGHDQGEDEDEDQGGAAGRVEGVGEAEWGSGGGGRGPWGLGWMKGRRPKWRRQPHHEDGEEEEEEEEEERDERGGHATSGIAGPEVEGGSENGGSCSVGVAGDVNTATTAVPPAADRTDLAPSREAGDASVSQRLGEALLARAGDSFRQFQPKQLSRLCWALGAWHEQGAVSLPGSGPFVTRALAEAGKHPKDYTAEELAQILWAFASLVGKADSTAPELAGLLGALAEGFESEGAGGGSGFAKPGGSGGGGVSGRGAGEGLDAATACDILWSFATIGHPAHSLCEAMARDLVDKVPELPPSSVSSLVWAYAKMGHPSAELMERVLSVVERRLGDFSVEDAASSLWALGALGYTVSLKRQFDVTKEDLQSLSPSASANLLWGLVKTQAAFAEGFDRECLEAVAADMGPKLLSFSPRELCRTAWALGRLGLGGVSPVGTMANDGGGESEDERPATDGCEMSGLMHKVLGECSKWLEMFTPQELETLLWAVCRLEHRADDLVAEMAAEGKRRQEELPVLLQQSGPSAARDAAFHLGAFRHLLAKYRGIDFDGQRARGRYRRGKSMLSRMFRER